MITAGRAGRPSVSLALGTRLEVGAVKLVAACAAQTQFVGGGGGVDDPGPVLGQEMTDERSGQAMNELGLFMRAD